MTPSCLCRALLSVSLSWGGSAAFAADPTPAATRPKVASLTIALNDGRSYALSSHELRHSKGGALFWGDWAVSNILVPFYFFARNEEVTPFSVIQHWWSPGHSGELPAFLLQTPEGPVYPLDKGGPAHWGRPFQAAHRPQVASVVVGYEDGRSCTLSELALRDPKSGVLVWNDYAVNHLLVPFYSSARNLPTSPEDVVRIWNTPGPAPSFGSSLRSVVMDELPGFLVKPRCIPSYPSPD